jgi:hypothetical protein
MLYKKRTARLLDHEENGSTHDWIKVVHKRVRNWRTPFQATDETLQPTNGIRQSVGQSVSQLKARYDEGTGGDVGPRKATRSRKERKVEKRLR